MSTEADEMPTTRIHPADIVFIRKEVERAVANGIAAGISNGLTDENVTKFWNGLVSLMQRHARDKAGDVVMGGMREGARSVFWVAVFVVAAWTLFGFKALIAAWAALRGA
jgi:hypothetical protein